VANAVYATPLLEHTIRDDRDYAAHMVTFISSGEAQLRLKPGRLALLDLPQLCRQGLYPASWAGDAPTSQMPENVETVGG